MINFRKANEKDIGLIRELAEKSWNAAYKDILEKDQIDYMLAEMYSEEVILSQIKSNNYQYYLMEKDQISAGFMGFENHYEIETTKLHRIYLLEEFKGKGIGKAALRFLKEKVVEAGDSRIILNVNKSNPAKEVYESQGFKVYKEDVFDIGKGYVMDDFLMEFIVKNKI